MDDLQAWMRKELEILHEVRIGQAEMRAQQVEMRQSQTQMMGAQQEILKDHETRIRTGERLMEQSMAILTSINHFVLTQGRANTGFEVRLGRLEKTVLMAAGVLVAVKYGVDILTALNVR